MIVTAQRHSHHFAIIVLCKVQWMVSSMAVFIQSLVHHDASISQNTTTNNQRPCMLTIFEKDGTAITAHSTTGAAVATTREQQL